jgi:hypothetical protein
MKEDAMGRACSTNGGFWWGSQKERDHQEEQDVGGWIIIKWILEG